MHVGRWVLLVSAVAGLTLSLTGQTVPDGKPAQAVSPYVAKFRITSVQKLANGTTITHESTETQALDSNGRQLYVTTTLATPQRPGRSFYRVSDRSAQTSTFWSAPGKIVTTQNLPTGGGCWTSVAPSTTSAAVQGGGEGVVMSSTIATSTLIPAQTQGSKPVRQELGAQTIQGLEAHGTKTTRTIPAGEDGNDAPLVHTSETWFADSVKLEVRQITEDPRTGTRTRELIEFTPGEPDSKLFESPEGYEAKTLQLHQIACEQ